MVCVAGFFCGCHYFAKRATLEFDGYEAIGGTFAHVASGLVKPELAIL